MLQLLARLTFGLAELPDSFVCWMCLARTNGLLHLGEHRCQTLIVHAALILGHQHGATMPANYREQQRCQKNNCKVVCHFGMVGLQRKSSWDHGCCVHGHKLHLGFRV